MTVNNKTLISSYIEKYKNEKPGSKLNPKKMMAISAFVEAKEKFNEQVCYEEFSELMAKSPNQIEFHESKYRGMKAKEVCRFLPDNEQGKTCKRYVRRLYKWFDVIITKEQIIAMSKLSITNGDMHRNYLKYVKGGEEK